MSSIVDKIVGNENLLWAWKKTKNCYRVGDIWFDEIELASFEANLYDELKSIETDIKRLEYTLQPIKPLPYPKAADKETGDPRVRQTFEIKIRDQVTWIAVLNIIGGSLDNRMPWWSYGHRLYVPLWKNEETWEIGKYTNSKGQLYRKWNQSWPLFRRHISLTAKVMCNKNIKKEDLEEAEQRVYDNNEFLPHNFKSKYLEKDYWAYDKAATLYWATIDFSKFYPSVKRNIIVRNILQYSRDANNNDDFKSLITNLLNFKVDYSEWTTDQLSKIELADKDFSGIPTGLFVAGFLANLSLLGVDEAISKKLDRTREIAHFRFVDDHVVLAYDFNKLKEWIENYKVLLINESIGVTFNYEKIEPKSLSYILKEQDVSNNQKTIEAQNIEDAIKKAEKESKLDPKFPSPLMTQTLSKISTITHTDFEFLSIIEEEQLIADLEHLLLTDFPDHEIRRDTRVSFAASILSRIVPNTKDDYSDVYRSQKIIHYKLKEYQALLKKNAGFINEKLHDLIFTELTDVDGYFQKWETEIEGRENSKNLELLRKHIKDEKDHENNLRKKIKEESESKKKKVYTLLLKAISENPEKVRIWSRIIDYCRVVGCCDPKESYIKINEFLKEDNIEILSANFLRSLFLTVLADRIMQSIHSLLNDKTCSIKEKGAITSFVKNSFNQNFLNIIFNDQDAENKSYYSKTYHFYRFVLGSAIFILQESDSKIEIDAGVIKKFDLIDWYNQPKEWINRRLSPDINTWLFWLLWRTHRKASSTPLPFWLKLQKYFNYSESTSKPLILPFPNYSHGQKISFDYILGKGFDEGWLFEFIKANQEVLNDKNKNALALNYPNLYNNLFNRDDVKINLWEFIQWQKNSLNNNQEGKAIDVFNKYFDPRYSEWTALELTKQILNTQLSAENFFFRKKTKLHPANFILKKDPFTAETVKIDSWEDWKAKIYNKLEVEGEGFQISDSRYTTRTLSENAIRNDAQASIYAIGLILLQLITHDTNFPWVWNSMDKNLIWETLIYKRLQSVAISSYTLLILKSCFSSKNREILYGAPFKKQEWDGASEPPLITDLYTLEKYVTEAQKIIERYQLSVENNMPRQLVPISLIQLSKDNNPLKGGDTVDDDLFN